VPVSRSCLGGDDTPCTMLQLKLAMFAQLPYPGKMIPGVFVTCADDILIFDSAVCDFTSPGFTALAHRSPLVTAAGHGVFALPGERASERAFLQITSPDNSQAFPCCTPVRYASLPLDCH
jgi:hypothetical protein